MPKQKYSFLKSSFLFLLFFLLIFNQTSLLFGDTDLSSRSFFRALSLKGKGDPEQVKSLLREAAINSPEPVRSKARLALLDVLYGEKNYSAVSVLGETFLKDNPKDTEIARLTVLSYMELGNYSLASEAGRIADYKSTVRLFQPVLVSEIALNSPGWRADLKEFLLKTPVRRQDKTLFSDLEKRIRDQGLYNTLSRSVTRLLSFRVYTEKKRYSAAAEAGGDIVSSAAAGYISPEIAESAARMFALAGRSSGGLKAFEEGIRRGKSRGISKEILSGMYWGAGYLSGRLGFVQKALDYYSLGMDISSGQYSDKLLWYRYSLILRSSPVSALNSLDDLISRWNDPVYFNDVLSDLSTELIRRGMWKELDGVFETLKGKAGGDVISRISYLTARGAMEGYINIDKAGIRNRLNLSVKSGTGLGSGLYYKIMSAAALEEITGKVQTNGIDGIFRMEKNLTEDEKKGCDELLYGSAAFDLKEYGKDVLKNCSGGFSLTAVRAFAEYLNRKGDYISSIRILNGYLAAKGYSVREDDIKILYPDAFGEKIGEIAAGEDIPPVVFAALIREESHFSPDIVSAAGAVGLSQLMPSTAEDVASRLRLENVDLTDPAVNMRLGGWYLKNLISRTDSIIQALFAYNGGLTRVRRWKKEYSSLPGDLFLEVIPYRETSLYGRKVLVSAVIYGYLYYNRSLKETVDLIFRSNG